MLLLLAHVLMELLQQQTKLNQPISILSLIHVQHTKLNQPIINIFFDNTCNACEPTLILSLIIHVMRVYTLQVSESLSRDYTYPEKVYCVTIERALVLADGCCC
jgi:hypothetical protein